MLSFSLPNVYIPHKVFFESLATICRSLKLETSQSRFLDCPVFCGRIFLAPNSIFINQRFLFETFNLFESFGNPPSLNFEKLWEFLIQRFVMNCAEKKLGKPIERLVKDYQTLGQHSTLASGPNCPGFDSHSS